MKANEYLDHKIIEDFRERINSTNIFYEIKEQKNRWNLVCVLLDRIDSAIEYLNAHSFCPKTEEELIFIFVFASIVKDGVYKFYENVFHKKPATLTNKRWFSCASHYGRPCFTQETCPTDDVFFEYVRSLSFAHPFETSKKWRNERYFMEDGEIHLSPFVICGSNLLGRDMIGIRTYTNKDIDKIVDMMFPFHNLKSFIKERYELIREFSAWCSDVITNQNNVWKQEKVNRNGSLLEVIDRVIAISESRFCEVSSLEVARIILTYQSDNIKNMETVNFVKEAIGKRIDKICDAIDNIDYDSVENELSIIYKRPKGLHEKAHYELEKIFSYLTESSGPGMPGSDEEWGIIQAQSFYEQYAKKYVLIDFERMNHKEIRILIRSACVFGWNEEQNNKKT